MIIPEGKKIYFASDQHFGVPDKESSLIREKHFVKWLEYAAQDASEIYLLGDLFDFWFEYKKAVPRGYVRVLGKMAEISDQGIPIRFFTGNHDMWIFDYLPEITGIEMFREPIEREYNGKKFYIGHGDGLGPGDHGYKFLKKIFANKFLQWCFSILHPNVGIGIANFFSRRSRAANAPVDKQFLGEDKEWLVIYAKEILEKQHFDYFLFGHRHFPIDLNLNEKSRYINLGDWVTDFTYAVFDGHQLELKSFGKPL